MRHSLLLVLSKSKLLFSKKNPLVFGTFFADLPKQPTNLVGVRRTFFQVWPPHVESKNYSLLGKPDTRNIPSCSKDHLFFQQLCWKKSSRWYHSSYYSHGCDPHLSLHYTTATAPDIQHTALSLGHQHHRQTL